MTVVDISTVAGAIDDNDALRIAMQNSAAELSIYFPAGRGRQPDGSYLITTEAWQVPDVTPARGNITRSNVTLYGDGMYRTIIRQPQDSNLMFMAHCDPAAPTNLLSNITVRDMSLYGNLSVRSPASYNQHNHLLRVAGVSTLHIENVEFRDFMGDGLNLSSPLRTLVPHNDNLTVLRCRFDGVSKKNRNGISILDCTTWSVRSSAFLNISDRDRVSPGAIDIEPEDSKSIIRDGEVYDCSFEQLGGYALSLSNGVGAQASGLEFTYCSVRTSLSALFAVGYNSVRAANLYVEDVGDALVIRTTNNLTVENSTFRGADMMRIGGTPQGLTIQNNGLANCGRVNGPVIAQDGDVDGVQVLNNHVIDCGRAGYVSPFYFVQSPTAAVRNVTIKGNVVEPSNVTDIGRVVYAHTGAVQNVDRTGNTPERIAGGAENL